MVVVVVVVVVIVASIVATDYRHYWHWLSSLLVVWTWTWVVSDNGVDVRVNCDGDILSTHDRCGCLLT